MDHWTAEMDEVARFFSGSVPLSSTAFAPLNPQLTLVSHKAHAEETVSSNGLQRSILVVVKNSPFHLRIATAASSKLDLNTVAFEAFLLYDCDDLKEVDYVRNRPLDFKPTASENGQDLDAELRIKVLSSQHEDLMFRVRLQGFHPITHEEIAGLTLLSPPVKVISKPEQLKKRQPSRKRTMTDMLVETVSRIEKKQEDQQQLIERILLQQTDHVGVAEKRQKTAELALWEIVPTANTASSEGKKEDAPAFEEAFCNLIRAYNKMESEEKPETIRKLIRNSSSRDTERLSELLDLFWTEGLQKEPAFGDRPNNERPGMIGSKEDGCNCPECPHKQELERIDEFYKEFLSGGVNTPSF